MRKKTYSGEKRRKVVLLGIPSFIWSECGFSDLKDRFSIIWCFLFSLSANEVPLCLCLVVGSKGLLDSYFSLPSSFIIVTSCASIMRGRWVHENIQMFAFLPNCSCWSVLHRWTRLSNAEEWLRSEVNRDRVLIIFICLSVCFAVST